MKRFVILLALALSGCRSVAVVDDIDFELDFTPLVGPSNALHSPYVLGSSMNLFVEVRQGKRAADWTISSSDPTVLAISPLDPGTESATANAVGEGSAEIIVRDGEQHVLSRQPIEVKKPDRVALLAHGLLIIGRNEGAATQPELRVRTGGTATFLAHYYRDRELLSGNGALSVAPPPNVDAQVIPTFLFEDRDWLQVTPSMEGDAPITLLVANQPIGTLPLVAVPDTDVAAVEVLGMNEAHARKNDPLVALAQASDSLGRVIYGVDYNWDLDGDPQEGLGDLYRYNFDPTTPRELTAHFGAMSASATIHGEGFVDSSNHVGCSMAPGRFVDRSMVLFFAVVIGLSLAVRYLSGADPDGNSDQGQLEQLQQGSSQSSGKSSQSKFVWPLHDAGSGAQVTDPQAGLPAHTGSAQQLVSEEQSLAVQGQHSVSGANGEPPLVTPCVPAGQVAVSPLPFGQKQPGSSGFTH